jgi:hypothetical protein
VPRIDSASGVLYRNQEAARLVRLRPEPQQALAVHHRAHSVGRIGDQIHHDLPQVDSVGGNRRKPVGQRGIYADAVIFQVAAQQREYFADQLVDVQRGGRHAVVPEHQADFVDDRTGAMAVADDAFECGARLLNVGALARQPALAGVGIRRESRPAAD